MNAQIITSHNILLSSYIPEKLLHREKELTQLSNYMSNYINTFGYGQQGSGKTTIIKRAIEDFNTTKKARAIYIDC